jgi:hypothetical protein
MDLLVNLSENGRISLSLQESGKSECAMWNVPELIMTHHD